MTIAIDYVATRPTSCAFFAGRAWYAGAKSSSKGSWVLFSQVATDVQRLNKCYQENDPTSEVFSDILDDDGGIIPIPDSGQIIALKPLGNFLFVFSHNGVWVIRSGEDGFKATNYTVSLISNVGALSSHSVVSAENSIYYWANQSIQKINLPDNSFSLPVSVSITKDTIETYYNTINIVNKIHAKGIYNNNDNIIYWLYSDSTQYKQKTTLLKFDTRIGCFYLEKINTNFFKDVSITKESSANTLTEEVAVGSDIVYVLTDAVMTTLPITNNGQKVTKFLSVVDNELTFSEYATSYENFNDWGTVESPAYIVTSYSFGGVGPARNKTAPFVTVFAKRTEEDVDEFEEPIKQSSILMQTRWDFTHADYTGKWSAEREVYRPRRVFLYSEEDGADDGYDVMVSKNKVRGFGKAMQVKWQAGEGKDMKLLGWTINFVGNQNV